MFDQTLPSSRLPQYGTPSKHHLCAAIVMNVFSDQFYSIDADWAPSRHRMDILSVTVVSVENVSPRVEPEGRE